MLDNFHIDDNWKKIGVRLSGGADSSIIYYALCDYFKNNLDVEIYPLTMNTEYKWWYSIGAKHVIDTVAKLTGKYPKDWFIYTNNEHKTEKDGNEYAHGITEMQKVAVQKYNLDAVYIGQTVNPPVEEFKYYFYNVNHNLDIEKLIEYIDDRDISRDSPEDLIKMTCYYDSHKTEQIIPFAYSDKKQVSNLYQHFGVMETLYPITYSCEVVPETKETPLVHCGHCFFCLERWWGFGRII